MDIITELKADHKDLKKIYTTGLKEKTTLAEKRKLFAKLVQLVPAHAKSEERSTYQPSKHKENLKSEACEGYEEHGLVDLLLEEMKGSLDSDTWEAKFQVVCELLEHHIKEEETEYFPELKKTFTLEQRKEMGERYRKSFETMLAAAKRVSDSRKKEEENSTDQYIY